MNNFNEIIRPPFANYDLVVYFGGGLFFTPFIFRYFVEPLRSGFPTFNIPVGTEIASEAVSILCLLFSIYIIGHLLAYLGSQFIEKTLDIYFGKVSDAIILASRTNRKNKRNVTFKFIFNRFIIIWSRNSKFYIGIRTLIHAPLMPFYLLSLFTGLFGHYETRITPSIIGKMKLKYRSDIILGQNIYPGSKWFKPLEYFVINRYPSAVPRMYNYLVISGLFRTLCIIFLLSIWMMIYLLINSYLHDKWLIQPFFGWKGQGSALIEISTLSLLCVFCLFSYIKFQRRYAEEAIMAAVFMKDED